MKDILFSTLFLASCFITACFGESCQKFEPPECNTRYSHQSYYPHEANCTLYYRCDNGSLGLFSCPVGTSFNHHLQICDDYKNVLCNRCDKSNDIVSTQSCTEIPTCTALDQGKTKPFPPNCNQYIYCDREGAGILSKCPNTLHFSPETFYCTLPEEANCPNCDMTTDIASTTLETCMEIPKCSASEIGYNKPYPPDCTMYLYCESEGDGLLSKCQLNYHFSPERKYCMPPEEANCPSCEVTATTLETLTTLEVCLETPKCSVSETGYNKPYPPDCTMYLYCDGESDGLLSKCQSNFHFSPDQLYCMLPELSNCPSCEVISTSDTTLETLTTIEVCLETPKCSISEIGLNKPYPPDCSLYLYCDGESNGMLSKCQSNYHFNPELLYCMPPEEANCPNCEVIPTTSMPDTTSVTSEVNSTIEISTTSEITSSSEVTTITSEDITTTYETTSIASESSTDNIESTTEILTTSSQITTTGICPITPTCSIAEHGDNKPYPPDCAKYIHCDENGNSLLSYCPPNLYFSPEKSYCTIESEANCPFCEELTTEEPLSTDSTVSTIGICPEIPTCTIADVGKLKPYPPDCSLYIYCNENEEAVMSYCKEGLHFNPHDLFCTIPEEANCPLCDTFISTIIDSTTQEFSSSTTNEISASTTEHMTTNYICPETPSCESGELGTTKPYPQDCTKYIYCNGSNIANIRTCPIDNNYSPTLNRCLPEEEAGCPICLIPSTTEYFETTEPTIIATSSPSLECPPIPNCDFEVVGVVKPYPPNCNLYVYCDVNYTVQIRKCKDDFQFDTNLLTCLDPNVSNCLNCISTTTTQIFDSTTLEFSSTSSNLFTDLTTLPQCEETPTCDIFDSGIEKPFPPDCTKYIFCSFGELSVESCENGQHFSPIDYECMDSNLANCPLCSEIITTTMESTTDESYSTEQPSTTIISTTEESTTLDPTTIESSTTADSTVEISTTEIPTSLPPCEMTPSCNIFDVGIMLTYPPNCTQFIYCSFGSSIITSCPTGQHFSPTEYICTDPLVANCPLCTEVETTTDEPTTEITTEEIFTTTPELTTDITSTIIIPTYPPCDETPTCEIMDVGIKKVYPPDCTKYIFCDFGGANITSCPLGLHFSPTEYVCVEPLEANCPLCSVEVLTTPEITTPNDITTPEVTTPNAITTTESVTTEELISTTLDDATTIPAIPDCEPTPTCEIFDEGIKKPYPPSCREYIYCQIGNTFEIRPCEEGQEFSPIDYECMLASEANCQLCNPILPIIN